MVVAPVQRLEIVAPKHYARKPRDEVALRSAKKGPQVIVLFELAYRIARRHVILDGGGVVARPAQPRGLQQSSDRVGLHLLRAAHDKPRFRQIEVRRDRKIINAGGKGRQADDRPEPDVDGPEKTLRSPSCTRTNPDIGGGGTAERQDA